MNNGSAPSATALLALTALLCGLRVVRADTSADRVTIIPVPAHGRPLVARADAEGTIHLLYGTTAGPQYVRSADHGRTFTAPLPVADRASRSPGLEYHGDDMAVDSRGRVHVALSTNAWKLKLPQDQWDFYYTRLEPGASAFDPLRNINHKPSEGYSLAADDRGHVTACWLSGGLHANISHDNGQTFGPNTEIDPAFDPCKCCTTSSVYGRDGKLAVLYREEADNERDMHLVLWDQAHNATSRTRISQRPWKIDTCPMTYFTVVRAGDGYLAAWPTGPGYDIYFARLDGSGNRLPPGEIKTSGHAFHRTGVLALRAPDGATVIAWNKDNQLGWQLYDSLGQPVGPPGSAATAGTSAAGVVDQDGQFILFR